MIWPSMTIYRLLDMLLSHYTTAKHINSTAECLLLQRLNHEVEDDPFLADSQPRRQSLQRCACYRYLVKSFELLGVKFTQFNIKVNT